MRLYLWLGGAVVALALIIGAYAYGVGVGRDRQLADDRAAMDRASTAMKHAGDAYALRDAAAASRDVERETVFREIVREVPRIIDRHVYRNICVDADGVQLLREATAAANGEPAPRR
ncbi:hypothetical protein [Sphingomonas baiyangensis]|uniref:Uncharacterized protein n=1 Tax=Sphingomonas baiyangensis TaxID=2572576 RepID=A0A4U1L1Y4_9SPHN|nr:hypothetical protein [Sphingomonas baiyangensis]TKD50592.1 hypothetical protein FBR43_07300 [Sphingomonas baiyangensis]